MQRVKWSNIIDVRGR